MLNNWLKSVNDAESLDKTNIKIKSNTSENTLELIDDYSVALISSDERRPKAIKESLANFHNHFKDISIIDLGYFRKNDPTFNIQLINELIESNILPFILDQDFRWYSQIVSALSKNKSQSNMCISNKIHFSEYGIPCDYLAFQRHLIDMDHIHRIADHSINSMSLGKVRAEVGEVEPVLRDMNNIYFDISAIRASDVPGSFNSMPSGLTCEEACQIMKYLGKSTNLQLVVLGGDFKESTVISDNIAQMIWYLLEGKNSMANDHPKLNSNFNEYIVDVQDLHETFTFVKNADTGRWWFCVDKDEEKQEFISCSYGEYQKTISDELPVRLLKHLTKV
jgi:hypothetical protein